MGAARRWLIDEWNWPQAGLLAAVFLLLLFPVICDAAGLAFALVYVLLPIYMVHQFEEHHDDGFRRYFNERLGHGRELLTRPQAFWTNALAIWALFAAAIGLAYFADIGFGLIVVFAVAANALVHLAGAIAWRGYNPGLTTAVLLFIPLSVWAAVEVGDTGEVSAGWYAAGIAVGVGLHVALVLYLKAHQQAAGAGR